jgi:hypothetical protein
MFDKFDIVKLYRVSNPELNKDQLYKVWSCEGEDVEIYIHDDSFERLPKKKWTVSVHDLDLVNWEIKDEGKVWRFYYKDKSVSNIHKGSANNQIKMEMDARSQGFARSQFGYMVFEQKLKRCQQCEKNYIYEDKHKDLWYYCSKKCMDKKQTEFKL